jgi:uncharacterized membrane protein YphA (DoxX/SURF4 family)
MIKRDFQGKSVMLKIIVSVLGRVLLSAIFIIAGLNKVLNWESSAHSLMQALLSARAHLEFPGIDCVLQLMQKHVSLCLLLATICELLGGLLVFLGMFVRFGAFLLVVYLIPTTWLFHAFWRLAPPESDMQVVMFMKNTAIIGGLLVVWAFGSGFQRFSTSLKTPS